MRDPLQQPQRQFLKPLPRGGVLRFWVEPAGPSARKGEVAEMDDLERYEPTPGSDLARFVERARERGMDAHALRPRTGVDGRRTLTLMLGQASADMTRR